MIIKSFQWYNNCEGSDETQKPHHNESDLSGIVSNAPRARVVSADDRNHSRNVTNAREKVVSDLREERFDVSPHLGGEQSLTAGENREQEEDSRDKSCEDKNVIQVLVKSH